MSLGKLKSIWERLGRTDPLWAVLSVPGRRHGGWNIEEFMATGHDDVSQVLELLGRTGTMLGDRVLDFGCGVGRLSNALADHAPKVVGVDIASSMIDHAKRVNQHPDRLEFQHYDGRTLPFPDNGFDSAVSLIVLQHSPPAVQINCLLELLRVVRPYGVLVVQIPSEPRQPQPLDPAAYRAKIELATVPATMAPGMQTTVCAKVTNISSQPWPRLRLVKLGNHWVAEGQILIQDDGRATLLHEVGPGGSVMVEMSVTAPDSEGRFELEFDLVQELVTWWADRGSATVRSPVSVRVGTELELTHVALTPTITVAPDDAEPASTPQDTGGITMHALHINFVKSLFLHCGARVLETYEDAMTGDEWQSYTYVVQIGL